MVETQCVDHGGYGKFQLPSFCITGNLMLIVLGLDLLVGLVVVCELVNLGCTSF